MSLKSWTCKGCLNTEMRITKNGLAEYCRFTNDNGHVNHTEWHGDLVTCIDKRTVNDDTIQCHDLTDLRNMIDQLKQDGYEFTADNFTITVIGGIRYE